MNEVVATTPTIGSNVEEVVYRNIRFIMWDIGGQESLRSSWSTYYVNTKVHFSHSHSFRNHRGILSTPGCGFDC